MDEDDEDRQELRGAAVYRDGLLERPRLVWMIDSAFSLRLCACTCAPMPAN